MRAIFESVWPHLRRHHHSPSLLVLRLTLLIMATYVMVGCDSDVEKIRQANEAARATSVSTFPVAETGATASDSSSPESIEIPLVPPVAEQQPSATPSIDTSLDALDLSADLDVFDLRDGDCFRYTGATRYAVGSTDELESVDLVPCVEDWEYRVVSSFSISGVGSFKGSEYFLTEAAVQCDRRWTLALYPTVESWELGDRTIACLQESYGLALEQRWRLDRMGMRAGMMEGHCYVDGPEAGVVEEVSCSDPQSSKVEAILPLTGTSFLGEDTIVSKANSECPETSDVFFYPTSKSWDRGDRVIACMSVPFDEQSDQLIDPELALTLEDLWWVHAEAGGLSRDLSFEEARPRLDDVLNLEFDLALTALERLGVNPLDDWPYCITALSTILAILLHEQAVSPVEAAPHAMNAVDGLENMADDLKPAAEFGRGALTSEEATRRCKEFEDELLESYQ